VDDLNLAVPIRQDPWYIICQRAMEDKRYESVRDKIWRGRKTLSEGMGYFNMDGPLYHDTRGQAMLTAAATSITGATTNKMCWLPAHTALPPMYFTPGKKVRLSAWISFTSGTTPGNAAFELFYGTTDAGTTSILAQTVWACITAVTAAPVWISYDITARGGAVPTATPLIAFGKWLAPIALCTAANQQASSPIPILTPAAVNIDQTVTTGGLQINTKNSGANANSFVTHDITFEALN